MSDRPDTSSVRDATDLIFAAEDLLTATADPLFVAATIDRIARAAKALRANHLDDALDHVTARAARVDELRPYGWLESTVELYDTPPETADEVPAAHPSDVEALRDRIRGGDPT